MGMALLALILVAKPWTPEARAQAEGPTPFWRELLALRPTLIGAAIVIVLAVGAGFIWNKQLAGLKEISYGFAIGGALAILAEVCERGYGTRARTMLAPVALGLGAVGATLLADRATLVHTQLGLVLGSAVIAALLAVGGAAGGSWARLSAYYASFLCAASIIGVHRENVIRAARAPVVFGILTVISIALAFGWSDFVQKQRGKPGMSRFWLGVVGAIVFVAGARLIAVRYLFYGNAFWICLGSVVAAAFVTWVLDEEREGEPGAFAIATLIWLAWLTVAFGLLQGYGIALAGLAAASFMFLLGSQKGLVSLGVVVAIAFYRVFLEQYPSEVRAIDIGQHYSVIGLVAGAALPVAVGSWGSRIRNKYAGTQSFLFSLLAGIVALAIILGLNFVIGSRGAVGFLLGLGFASFALGLGGVYRISITGLSSAFAAAMIAGFGYVAPHIGIERETKIRVIGWALAIAVIVLILAEILFRKPKGVAVREDLA